MSEILSKAKRTDNGEWAEGYYCKRKTGYYDNIGFHEEYKDCIIVLFSDGGITWVDIDPETLCLYTGLTDKNGEKIWENDILRYSYDYPGSPWLKQKGLSDEDIKYYIGAVFWQDWRGTWAVCGKGKSRMTNQDVYVCNRNPNRTEVIGNIFDNPELLKEE